MSERDLLHDDRMWMLAASFPTLRRWAEAGAARGPFTGQVVFDALPKPWVTTGSRFALLFLADVWNVNMRAELPEQLRAWSFVDAWGGWDGEHRAAAMVWLERPVWP